jgi:hypothetical protein
VSTLAIILTVFAVLVLLLLLGGFLGARKRDRAVAPDYARHLAEADHALEAARAEDRGWDRATMEAVAREAVERERPGARIEDLQLVLVDDRPGVVEDRAHFEAGLPDGRVHVVLTRSEAGTWTAAQVD